MTGMLTHHNLTSGVCVICIVYRNKEASLVSVERAKMINTGLGVQYRDWHGNIESKRGITTTGIDWDNFENMIAKARKIKIIGGEPQPHLICLNY